MGKKVITNIKNIITGDTIKPKKIPSFVHNLLGIINTLGKKSVKKISIKHTIKEKKFTL